MRKQIYLAIAASMLAAPLHAGSAFHEIDGNADGSISKEEYQKHVEAHGNFGGWDADGDGYISLEEYEGMDVEGDYAEWDLDGDNRLSANEVFGGLYERFDKDKSGDWTSDELDEAGEAGVFDA